MSDEQFSAENADGAVMSLQGGQVGHDNIMYNLWLENRKIDASRVEQLSSHAAADYLIGLKADDAAESMRGTHGYYRYLRKRNHPLDRILRRACIARADSRVLHCTRWKRNSTWVSRDTNISSRAFLVRN